MTLLVRFENALSLALVRKEGWTGLPPGEVLAPGLGRTLVCGQGALVMLPGDGLDAAWVRDQKHRLALLAEQGAFPESWRALSLLYVFQHPCSPELRAEIVRDEPLAAVLSIPLQAGVADLSDGTVILRPGDGVPPASLLKEAVARARRGEADPEIDDDGAYQLALEDEAERKERFFQGFQETIPWATGLIIAVCLAVFAWSVALSGGNGPSGAVLWSLGACYGPLVREGEAWRLLSALFLHGGVLHLAANMYSLWIVGPVVERFFGTLRYLVLFCLSGLVASAASATFSENLSVGASGALFGMLGAMVGSALRFGREIPTSVRGRLIRGFGITIALNVAIGLYLSGGGGVKIDNLAHLGGLMGGAVFGLLVRPGALGLHPGSRLVAAFRKWVMVPCMVGLALLPFLVEAHVVSTMLQAPALWQRTYVFADPKGRFTVRVPVPLRVVEEEPTGVAFASSEGVEVLVMIAEVEGPGDVGAARTRLIRALGADGVTVDAQEQELLRGRSWVVIRGHLARKGVTVEVALTQVGSRLYRLQANAPDSQAARSHAALHVVMENLSPR